MPRVSSTPASGHAWQQPARQLQGRQHPGAGARTCSGLTERVNIVSLGSIQGSSSALLQAGAGRGLG